MGGRSSRAALQLAGEGELETRTGADTERRGGPIEAWTPPAGDRRHDDGGPAAPRGVHDLVGGGILMAGAAAFGLAAAGYDLGTPGRMGTGLFPLMLSVLLFVLGLAIAGRALLRGLGGRLVVNLRGLAWIMLPCAAFGATIDDFGLIPVLLLTVFASSFAARRLRVGFALAVSVAVVAFCYAVFLWGLGVPLPAFHLPAG